MKALLLLMAATLAAQPPQYIRHSDGCGYLRVNGVEIATDAKDEEAYGCRWRQMPRQWWRRLQPDLDLRPVMDQRYNIGTTTAHWGGKTFQNVYILAPNGKVIIYTEDGRRVEITAAEIERRATK